MTSDIVITSVRGAAIAPWIPALAALRIRVFRDFPYLYDGSEDYEQRYLQTYVAAPSSIAVLALHGDRVVGASTGLAMVDEESAFIQPFADGGYCLQDIFYCGESVLLPEYRGRGIYREFFMRREHHARMLNGIKLMTFCAVERAENHPLRPSGYEPLDRVWAHFGYARNPSLRTTFDWKDVDEVFSSKKTMVFYTKALG